MTSSIKERTLRVFKVFRDTSPYLSIDKNYRVRNASYTKEANDALLLEISFWEQKLRKSKDAKETDTLKKRLKYLYKVYEYFKFNGEVRI